MAEAQANTNSITLFRTRIHFLRLFGVCILLSQEHSPKSNEIDPKKRRRQNKPNSFNDDDDDEREHKRQKIYHHENSDATNKNAEIIDAERLFNFIATTMGGSNIELIIERRLTKTDLNNHHGHLAIPRNQIMEEFLTEEEEEKLKKREKSLNVTVIDPSLRLWDLKLCRWNYQYVNKNGSSQGYKYVLNYKWNQLKNANSSSLEESALIQIWSFRIRERLGLAFLRV